LAAISRLATGINVESGDISEVLVRKGDVQKTMGAFDLQWAMVNIIAATGGPEALDDGPDHPEFLNED
jgi:hypothetical protein